MCLRQRNKGQKWLFCNCVCTVYMPYVYLSTVMLGDHQGNRASFGLQQYADLCSETIICCCRMTKRKRGWISLRGKRKTRDCWMRRMLELKADLWRRLDLVEKWLVPRLRRHLRMSSRNRKRSSRKVKLEKCWLEWKLNSFYGNKVKPNSGFVWY